ncbi:MAG: tetratricopeptide (TPR) repeat protein [Alphaproteobacteria bacterium]|jgi:tetratricopeptide (TPR) repeat protein
MKKFFSFTLILLCIASIFFYLGYEPEPYDIDVSGTFFGYNIQTSQYTLYALLIIVFIVISAILRSFVGIKNIYQSIVYFFTGRNKDKATENLLNAYAHLAGQKPKSAIAYLKKADKYFKESPHTAIVKLLIEQSQKAERPTSQSIAYLENNKLLKPIGCYLESLFPVSQKDNTRTIELLKNARNFVESKPVFDHYLALLIGSKDYNEAEIALKAARNVLTDEDYKFNYASILLLKSSVAQEEKNIDQMLALSLESLKHYKSPLALQYVIQAYKTLQRDNKAIRLLNDYFTDKPSMNVIRLFLELKGIEIPEATAKRIASLPRTHVNSEGFMALQAYHFTISRDFISLNTVLNNATEFYDSLWVKAAQLCLTVEKDPVLLSEALKLFKDALYAQCHHEIDTHYKSHTHGALYYAALNTETMPEITQSEVIAMLGIFKNLLKSVPILHKKNGTQHNEALNNADLYRLEANIHKKS